MDKQALSNNDDKQMSCAINILSSNSIQRSRGIGIPANPIQINEMGYSISPLSRSFSVNAQYFHQAIVHLGYISYM